MRSFKTWIERVEAGDARGASPASTDKIADQLATNHVSKNPNISVDAAKAANPAQQLKSFVKPAGDALRANIGL